jgi:hypothetical protein
MRSSHKSADLGGNLESSSKSSADATTATTAGLRDMKLGTVMVAVDTPQSREKPVSPPCAIAAQVWPFRTNVGLGIGSGIPRWSIWLDLKILIRTIPAVLIGIGAIG